MDGLGGRPGVHSARFAGGRAGRAAPRRARRRRGPRARATSASSSRSRRTARERRGTGDARGPHRRRAARQRGLRLRPDLRPGRARSGRSPNSATRGSGELASRARRAALAQLAGLGEARFSSTSAARLAAAPPVDLGAEHDHVRHHVEPHEQERQAAERLQGITLFVEPHVDRQRLEASPAAHRSRTARPAAPRGPCSGGVRQPAGRSRAGRGTRRQGTDRDGVDEPDARCRTPRAWRVSRWKPNSPTTRPGTARQEPPSSTADSALPRKNGGSAARRRC